MTRQPIVLPLVRVLVLLIVAACSEGLATHELDAGQRGDGGAEASSRGAGGHGAGGGGSIGSSGSGGASTPTSTMAGTTSNTGGGDPGNDAGVDAGRDAGGDAGSDAGVVKGDGGTDTGADAGRDAGAYRICQGSAKAVKVYMIGDSTMSVYTSDLYPRMGWGQPLGERFDSRCATVVDKALSGRSSKSFYDEGNWTPIKNALSAGDYVLIQFGHNDEKSDDPARYTVPETTYKQYLTTYVKDTQSKKAQPILLTSINRNSWSGKTLSDTHGAYPPAVRELATSLGVDLIDLTALTKAYFERLGQAETTKLFMVLAAGQYPNYPNGNTDNTHLQEKGARIIGQLAMADAYSRGLSLGTLLNAVPAAP